MSHPLLKNCLDALSRAGNDEMSWKVLQGHQSGLLSDPEIGTELVAIVAAAGKAEDIAEELMVLEALIDGARMDRENDGTYGADFLAALDNAIVRLYDEGRITEAGIFLLGSSYVRAGLAAPEYLRRSRAGEVADYSAAPGDLPDLEALLDRLREEARGDAYSIHAALNEMLATFDADTQSLFIAEIIERDDPFLGRLGCYWLLDNARDIRRVAADAFLRRSQAGKLDAAITSRLLEMRNWLPADAARDTLDKVLKEALRREVSGGVQPRPWKLHKVLASVPDGAGAQSFAIAAQRDGQRGVVMLLLKQGFGVKDAYVVPCSSATDQKRMLAHIAEEIDALDAASEILEPALAAALAEGHALGEPPAHGLVDVVEVCGIHQLRPVSMSVQDWITHLDPGGELSRLSPQKLGRLVNLSADWPVDYDVLHSWFEDSAAVRDILIHKITRRSRETALWRHLETRREWWASLIVKTAVLLKASADEPEDRWKSFAATARALIGDRPLRKVPIMASIVAESLESADDPWGVRAGDTDVGETVLSDDEIEALIPPAPETRGELKRLMKSAGMEITPEWLDGYLAAIIVAPKLIMPSGWINGVLEQKHDFADHAGLQRFLDLVLFRYNASNDDLEELVLTGAGIKSLDEQGLRRWAEGFSECIARHKKEWTARTMTGEDKRVVRSIADMASGRAGASEIKPLLPAWLTHRRMVRG